MLETSPTLKGFRLTDLLSKIITWRNDLPKFFEDITGLTPRPFQSEFLREVQGLKSKNIVIVAGRGIGKTLSLSVVALWYVFILSITERRPMKVVILGGSLVQAQICYNYIMEFISRIPFLQEQLAKEPTQKEILFKDGSWIKPLPASEKSIRGHHPDLLIIDEAAQVEDNILFAALPMTSPSPYARHIFSTTPHLGQSWIENIWEKQERYEYPSWKFFNWNAESFLPPAQLKILRQMLPEDKYRSEIQGLPYTAQGKVFRLADLKKCREENISQSEEGEIYAGIDWGYYPAPTVLVIVQKTEEGWKVLHTQEWLREYSAQVLDDIERICHSYNVITIFTDSTDKGENLRLSAKGLPVQPVSFKAEKSVMLANLRMLIEQHKIKFDPITQQRLIQQLIDYTYNSKRNDDYVDALMLAVRSNPIVRQYTDLLEILREGISHKTTLSENEDRKKEISSIFREVRRIKFV